MTKWLLGIIIVLIILVGGYYIYQHYNSNNSTGSPTADTSVSNTISIVNMAFNPTSYSVPVGTTVTWVNNDTVAHSIKSTSFNSDNLNPGQSYSFTFSASGTYSYSCGIHPTMQGSITVQ